MAIPQITLLTGIPRSGTTLCCSLVNQHTQFVALHEPMQPKNILADSFDQMIRNIEQRLSQFEQDLQKRSNIDNGAESLLVDNPIGQLSKNELRQVTAKRTKVVVGKDKSVERLFVKQNAMFTALIKPLTIRYPMVAIVRNPVDVLCSWLSVDLPVNRGRLPAGEKIDMQLKNTLAMETSVFARQCVIYQWFINRYKESDIDVVCYEDIIQSKGAALFEKLNVQPNIKAQMTFREPSLPSKNVINTILENADKINALNLSPFYSNQDIEQRLNWLSTHS